VAVRIEPRSPAARAGLRPGDIIIAWSGEPVGTVGEFRARFGKVKAGDRIVLGIERDGARQEAAMIAWGNI
jgi:S1-C subfamily serine protease